MDTINRLRAIDNMTRIDSDTLELALEALSSIRAEARLALHEIRQRSEGSEEPMIERLAEALAVLLGECDTSDGFDPNLEGPEHDASEAARKLLEEYREATTTAPMPYEAWPAANGDDPAEWRIDRDRGNGTADIIAWVYTEADAKMIADALNREK